MSDHVAWSLELSIDAANVEGFKTLMKEMVDATRDEPGARSYEWSFSGDGTTCHIYERYADSAATMAHLGNFGKSFAERFMSLAKPTRFVVYGNPNAEVKSALADFGPLYLPTLAGFSR